MISERQSKILNYLIKEYLDSAEPVSSSLLKKKTGLDISPATIRNDLQELMEQGYIAQPHTSAGRVPTDKGYKYFVEISFSQAPRMTHFISREMEQAKKKIDQELELARALMNSLSHRSSTLSYTRFEEKDSILEILKIIGPSQTAHSRNIDVMRKLLEEFNNL